MSEMMTGAEMVVRALQDQGVESFRLSGRRRAANLRRPLPPGQFKHVLVRHEQGAAHAAEGFARSCGKVGSSS